MKDKNRIIIIIIMIVCFLFGSFGTYYLISKKGLFNQTIINKSEKEVTVNENGIADAVEKLYDAVVVVQNYQKNTLASSGTGFIYKTDVDKAYILTNAHVVSGASSVKLIFTNNKTYDAEIVGSDTYSDIAILSVNKDNIIQVAEIGSYQDARLGDTLFTIGAPLDAEYSWTVTRGILSGKDRLVEISQSSNTSVDKWVMKVMQTDAAINSGNSGGPIANSNGEVIGITNMKLVSSGVEGMGFAIPIEDAIKYAEKLIESGKIDFELISYIRGKTFDNTLLLVEEAENLSPEELLLVMTRIGENSKLVISGDPRQADRKYTNKCGLSHAIDKLLEMEEVAVVKFTDDDVVRNTLITKILKAWKN